jgi:hypothetical protein
MMKKLLSAVALTVAFAMPSVAATLNGTFSVTVVNAQNRTSAQSQATLANANAALDAAMDGTSGYAWDDFTYTGDLDFSTKQGATTIAQWLETGVGGVVEGLDAAVGGLLLSKGNINNGTATTTFFAFTLLASLGPSDFTITHDDGIGVYDLDGFSPVLVGESVGPTPVLTTEVKGFNGGSLGILYVATNGNPSILKVEVSPVPVPAAGFLLIGALGGLVALRRRKTA